MMPIRLIKADQFKFPVNRLLVHVDFESVNLSALMASKSWKSPGFQVSVHDVFLMRRFERFIDVFRDTETLANWNWTTLNMFVENSMLGSACCRE